SYNHFSSSVQFLSLRWQSACLCGYDTPLNTMKQPFIVGMLHLLPADRRLEMEESQTVKM
ncbi:MAG: hypothetical protein MUO99_04915, partial [Dehalococcoidales bacterium]|nr:hypothetical protein [Dehalococcoidales bacterium]